MLSCDYFKNDDIRYREGRVVIVVVPFNWIDIK